MTVSTVGDLARSLVMRHHNTRVRSEMDALVKEVSTGRAADLAKHLSGDYAPLNGIERDLRRLDAFSTATSETTGMAETMQTSLGRVQDLSVEFAPTLLNAASMNKTAFSRALGEEAMERFESVVSALNARFADRAIFSGTATDSRAVASASDMLDSIETLAAGAVSAGEVAQIVRDWFDPGGGYDTEGYSGAADSMGPVTVSEGRTVTLEITAADQRVRDSLKGFAMAAMLNRSPVDGNFEMQVGLSEIAGEALLSAQAPLSQLRGEVGSLEAALEEISTANSAETAALEIARSGLVDIDVYDRASRLESAQSQLEILYTITARSSQLSLVGYLR